MKNYYVMTLFPEMIENVVRESISGRAIKAGLMNVEAQEESLDAAIADEEQHGKELEEKKVYVKTKEFTMEKAREIFGLKLPDEIIIKPDEK